MQIANFYYRKKKLPSAWKQEISKCELTEIGQEQFTWNSCWVYTKYSEWRKSVWHQDEAFCFKCRSRIRQAHLLEITREETWFLKQAPHPTRKWWWGKQSAKKLEQFATNNFSTEISKIKWKWCNAALPSREWASSGARQLCNPEWENQENQHGSWESPGDCPPARWPPSHLPGLNCREETNFWKAQEMLAMEKMAAVSPGTEALTAEARRLQVNWSGPGEGRDHKGADLNSLLSLPWVGEIKPASFSPGTVGYGWQKSYRHGMIIQDSVGKVQKKRRSREPTPRASQMLLYLLCITKGKSH